jgi:enoyl-CoA hydratase
VIERHDRGPVAVLRLRHHKGNALDLELLAALTEELGRVERDGSQALVLTGHGSIFSAGVNLFRVLDGGEGYLRRFLPALSEALRLLFTYPKPVVAAVNGHAIAGGWALACACDYRVMADGYGKLGMPELQVGVPYPPLVLEVLRSATPATLLSQLVFGGRTFTGGEAFAAGLVEESASPEEVVDRAVARAATLGELPVAAFHAAKLQLRAPGLERAAAAAAAEEEVLASWAAPETQTAIRRYLEGALGRAKDEG